MNRRTFIKTLAGLGGAAAAFTLDSPFRPHVRLAEAANGKSLIVVFQRGGCDGLNTVVPYGDDQYYNLRPTIAIAPPNPGDRLSTLDLDGFLGLHPSLAPFQSIFANGDMAVLPTVHYSDASRSHFDGQQFIESAARSKTLDGWLNRHLQGQPGGGQLSAVGFGNELPQSLRGSVIVSSFSTLGNFNLGISSAQQAELLPHLATAYGQPGAAGPYRDLVQQSGQVTINDLSTVSALLDTDYSPANGAVYPNSGFGRQMRDTAQMIKAGVGLEIAALSIGGWDTHNRQGGGEASGSQARRFSDFSGAIGAFYTDLGTQMSDVLVLTMTEFGRTAKENGSLGTDHGNASSWFAIGGGLQGGTYLGNGWPGLRTEDLYRGRYLAHTIDYRDVFAEALSRHLGETNLASIIPNHSYSPIGFLPG